MSGVAILLDHLVRLETKRITLTYSCVGKEGAGGWLIIWVIDFDTDLQECLSTDVILRDSITSGYNKPCDREEMALFSFVSCWFVVCYMNWRVFLFVHQFDYYSRFHNSSRVYENKTLADIYFYGLTNKS